MKESVEEYCRQLRENVAKTEKNPEAKQLANQAINSFENAVTSNRLSENDLNNIVTCAKSKWLGSLEIGVDLLAKLLNKFPVAKTAWRELSNSRFAYERWAAIVALNTANAIPEDFAKELLQKAINDKSSKVRLFAVDGT